MTSSTYLKLIHLVNKACKQESTFEKSIVTPRVLERTYSLVQCRKGHFLESLREEETYLNQEHAV